MAHDLALILVATGCAVTVASCIGALARRSGPFDRLHFVTPVTSVGCPLVAIGLSVEQGWGLTTASLLLVAGLLFVCGPVLEAATGRLMAQTDRLVPPSTPE